MPRKRAIAQVTQIPKGTERCVVVPFDSPTYSLKPLNVPDVPHSLLKWISASRQLPSIESIEKEDEEREAPSNQGVNVGMRIHPFNFTNVLAFKAINEYHSRCIETRVSATVGLGHSSEKVAGVLDPLCDGSWHELLIALDHDLEQTNNAYVEVVGTDQEIFGLHRIPCDGIWVYVENRTYDTHFVVSTEGSFGKRFSKFGDHRVAVERGVIPADESFSEVIHLKRPSSSDRFYGVPDWIAAIQTIDLDRYAKQFALDFFNNRGTPGLILAFEGGKVDEAEWEKIVSDLNKHRGSSKMFKTLAYNVSNAQVQSKITAIQGSGITDAFAALTDLLALKIVSAHGVPACLAGIATPGRLGGTSELQTAMLAFQALVVGPAQQYWERALNATLGNPRVNRGLPLSSGDFELRTILEEIPVPALTATKDQKRPSGDDEKPTQEDGRGNGSTDERDPDEPEPSVNRATSNGARRRL